eukprot:387444-Hanusia_phi.AAC.1
MQVILLRGSIWFARGIVLTSSRVLQMQLQEIACRCHAGIKAQSGQEVLCMTWERQSQSLPDQTFCKPGKLLNSPHVGKIKNKHEGRPRHKTLFVLPAVSLACPCVRSQPNEALSASGGPESRERAEEASVGHTSHQSHACYRSGEEAQNNRFFPSDDVVHEEHGTDMSRP